jgi:hypothetical protein
MIITMSSQIAQELTSMSIYRTIEHRRAPKLLPTSASNKKTKHCGRVANCGVTRSGLVALAWQPPYQLSRPKFRQNRYPVIVPGPCEGGDCVNIPRW